jgi:hypothetical protein
MKAKYKIGDGVYYKRLTPLSGNSSDEYIVRDGIVMSVRIQSSCTIPSYEVVKLGAGINFVLPEDEVYKTQEEALKSIK